MPGTVLGIGYGATNKTKFTIFMDLLVQVLANSGSQTKSDSRHVFVKKFIET